MKKSLFLCLLLGIIVIAGCNNGENSNQTDFNNTLKCQEFKEQFLKDMVNYFDITATSPDLPPYKNSIEIFYSKITNSCIGIARGDDIVRNDYDMKNPNRNNQMLYGESLYIIQDIFNSNRCRIHETTYYNQDGPGIEKIEFRNICTGLPTYDNEKFATFFITGNNIGDNLHLSKEIFENEVNYLKGN